MIAVTRLLPAVMLASACSTPDSSMGGKFGSSGTDDASGAATSGAETSSASGDTEPSTTGSSGGTEPGTGGSETTGETKFDLPMPDAPPTPEAEPCTKVDLLFVVDNSGSMAGEQQNLVNSFPGFVTEIQGTLGTVESLHVGVISTEIHKQNPLQCQKLGALSQASSLHGNCVPYSSGKNWMDETEPNMQQKFTCAGQLGTGGSGDERPMDALQLALTPNYNAAGACNDGFLRDDALLVVVVITDEEDDNKGGSFKSQGDPPDWFQGVIKQKQGVETNVVVLGLVGHEEPNECEGVGWVGSSEYADPAPRLQEFAQMFTYGFLGDVCAESYQPFFHEAISVIDSACTNFTPPEG